MRRSTLFLGLLTTTVACGTSSDGDPDGGASTGGQVQAPSGGASTGGSATGGVVGTGGAATGGATTTGGESGSGDGGAATGGETAAGGSSGGDAAAGGAPAGGTGAETGSGGGGDPATGGTDGGSGGTTSNCTGQAWPTADPTQAGPFAVTAEKEVGPLAGSVPDPIYGDQQQRFNVYRPQNLADSGYCHPILIWANGFQDNPEQKPPDCVVNESSNQWCGQYLPMLNHLASHGFVVVASLSTVTGREPLPTLVGMDWILEQAEDETSPYYQRLDTVNIGQLGHSFGGMSTCMTASDPRYKALATIWGTAELSGVHTPMLFFCGGRDSVAECDGIRDVFRTVTDQPAFFLNEVDADHGSWVYEGPGGVSLSSAAAWFRVHLMGDTANRKYFYGENCEFCTDNRTETEQNSLMME